MNTIRLNRMKSSQIATAMLLGVAAILVPTIANAQAVCLPAPRLLTTKPMGGQVGTTVEVTIAGDNIENTEQLSFSHAGLTAKAIDRKSVV